MQETMFRASIEYLKGKSEQMLAPRTPDRVAVFLASDTLGGFVSQNIAAAWAVAKLHTALVYAAYKNDADYKSIITDCNPSFHSEMKAEADSGATLLVDWFDIGQGAPVKCPSPEWEERRLNQPDIFLLPPMLSVKVAHLAELDERDPGLELPTDIRDKLLGTLEQAGLDRSRWFACVHVSGSEGTNPDTDLSLIRHILNDQGGQVVRVGKSGEQPFPEIEGVIDLASDSINFLLHLAAISAARYVIGDDPDFATLASAFRVPAALTDALDYSNSVWRKDGVVLTKRLILPDGRRLGSRQAFEEGFLDVPLPEGVRAEHNSQDDIKAVAGRMFDMTDECQGWRSPYAPPKLDELSGLTFPFPLQEEPLITFWD